MSLPKRCWITTRAPVLDSIQTISERQKLPYLEKKTNLNMYIFCTYSVHNKRKYSKNDDDYDKKE
jgi:hypothetical protein